MEQIISTPKRPRPTVSALESWYGYHAGYSATFVRDVMKSLRLTPKCKILDPWNGTGITTFVAHEAGIEALGFDISPVMVIVAKSRTLGGGNLSRLERAWEDVLNISSRLRKRLKGVDPLSAWFEPKAARYIRSIEAAIRSHLGDDVPPLYCAESLAFVASLPAFLYVVLFRTVRAMLASFGTSNPTWIRSPRPTENRLDPTWKEIRRIIEREFEILTEQASRFDPSGGSQITIDVANSEALPLPDACVDAVISSPPYCTRIDYAVATWPELAVLGCPSRVALRDLRDRMIGTPTVKPSRLDSSSEWGRTCNSFLKFVEEHPSRASESYYLKYYMQYFQGMFLSLRELDRVLCRGGRCVLVVQDSYYKDIHNDLPRIIEEMASGLNWSLIDRALFPVQSNLAAINRGTRRYRSKIEATEAVLIFAK